MPKGKGKHLTIADRVRIEAGIKDKESFSSIARALGVSPSTITREVKTNRHSAKPKGASKRNYCAHKTDCEVKGLCEINCRQTPCKNCRSSRCNKLCEDYEERVCRQLEHAPYVCTNCNKLGICSDRRFYYRAIYAHEAYETRLTTTRQGISITPEELDYMVRTVKRLLSQGQSLEAIWSSHEGEFPVGVRTFYNYVASGLFGIANIELPRKVRYKPRKTLAEKKAGLDISGRTYSDFLVLPEEIQRSVVQMDCVMGKRGDFKCILTLHFPRFEFQIFILLTDHTRECVVGALDWVETLAEGDFQKIFPVIVTDRGGEFRDYESIERSVFRVQKRTKVFYCDPLSSGQKGSCEKNHVELRRIIPKGTSLEALTNYEIAEVASHVNSYPRRSLGGLAPITLASQALPQSLLDGLGIRHIPPDDVILKPSLIK